MLISRIKSLVCLSLSGALLLEVGPVFAMPVGRGMSSEMLRPAGLEENDPAVRAAFFGALGVSDPSGPAGGLEMRWPNSGVPVSVDGHRISDVVQSLGSRNRLASIEILWSYLRQSPDPVSPGRALREMIGGAVFPIGTELSQRRRRGEDLLVEAWLLASDWEPALRGRTVSQIATEAVLYSRQTADNQPLNEPFSRWVDRVASVTNVNPEVVRSLFRFAGQLRAMIRESFERQGADSFPLAFSPVDWINRLAELRPSSRRPGTLVMIRQRPDFKELQRFLHRTEGAQLYGFRFPSGRIQMGIGLPGSDPARFTRSILAAVRSATPALELALLIHRRDPQRGIFPDTTDFVPYDLQEAGPAVELAVPKRQFVYSRSGSRENFLEFGKIPKERHPYQGQTTVLMAYSAGSKRHSNSWFYPDSVTAGEVGRGGLQNKGVGVEFWRAAQIPRATQVKLIDAAGHWIIWDRGETLESVVVDQLEAASAGLESNLGGPFSGGLLEQTRPEAADRILAGSAA
ncbi:MAG: hypothetical protein COV76_07590 [Candidatus Omnitrophica bacterium CG11_big_fil_rev_8_21_14_0_20_64_10]|nr:MAG: hypothetical protein COV76_07590 [Candidatus Omnitrophica bacterium CG11_big_fil_rev_8_21_14_0_20_64_10]